MKPPMKPHSKPPANHLQTAFHAVHHALFSLLFTLFSLHSSASVPLAWQVTPRNPAPVAFDRHHGETLEFRCTFTGFGELPFGAAADIRLWYQTNGMSAAWWSVPASVSSNVLSATFPPTADPGADRLSLFFGAPSNAYASAVLRLRHSPGFAPNILPPPDVTSWAAELAAVRALIDYSTSNAELVATIKSMAPAPGNYAAVSNAAMSAVQQNDLDDFYNDLETGHKPVSWAYKANGLEDYGSGDSLGAAEIFDLLASAITTNDVCDIVTNEVATSWIYGEWVWTGAPDENPGPPVYHASTGLWTIPDIGDFYAGIGRSVSAPANATSITWTIYFKVEDVSIMVGDASPEYCELWMGDENMYSGPTTNAFFHADDYYQAESATVEQIGNGSGHTFTFYKFSPYPVTASRTATASSTRNALGLARLIDLPPLTNGIPDAAARAVYDVHDLMWDATESILYWHKMRGGHDEYIAVTNIDLTHPSNAAALKAWREANR